MSSLLERKSKSDLDSSKNIENLLRTVANKINTINSESEVVDLPDYRTSSKDAKRKIKGEKKKSSRFTEPKKRSFLKRVRLQKKFNKGAFDYIEDDLKSGEYTKEQLEKMRFSKKRRERKLYKKIQDYEDAVYDVTTEKSWEKLKLGLAMTALAGAITIGGVLYKNVSDVLAQNSPKPQEIISIEQLSENEKNDLEIVTDNIKQEILENVGYHFDNLSDEEFMEGYFKIINKEKGMSEQIFEGASAKLAEERDQLLLDRIVEESFGEKYAELSEGQKRDYKQLAFELLSYALPEKFENGGNPYLRNPIVMEELAIRENLRDKGYRIELVVNGDEKETVRNLGNILHAIQETPLSDYKFVASIQNGQQLFFDDILEDAIGENYDGLSQKEKRDYIQITYEWLPDEAKEYIKDPIILDKETVELENQNNTEIGDER